MESVVMSSPDNNETSTKNDSAATTTNKTAQTEKTVSEPQKASSTVFVTDWQKEVQKVLYNEVWQDRNGYPFTFKFDENSFVVTKFDELGEAAKKKCPKKRW